MKAVVETELATGRDADDHPSFTPSVLQGDCKDYYMISDTLSQAFDFHRSRLSEVQHTL